jgi:hypothetical protein
LIRNETRSRTEPNHPAAIREAVVSHSPLCRNLTLARAKVSLNCLQARRSVSSGAGAGCTIHTASACGRHVADRSRAVGLRPRSMGSPSQPSRKRIRNPCGGLEHRGHRAFRTLCRVRKLIGQVADNPVFLERFRSSWCLFSYANLVPAGCSDALCGLCHCCNGQPSAR